MNKKIAQNTFKMVSALLAISALSSCSKLPTDYGPTEGISWWLTAIFFFLWLFFSCPIITMLIMGGEYTDGSDEDKELKYTLAGTSVYAFPIMFVMSHILGVFCDWYVGCLISIVIGFVVGYMVYKRVNPVSDANIHKTKWLWIVQGIMIVISVILATAA